MLVVYDTETTGFSHNHIVEIAAVALTDDGDRYDWYSRCRPSSPIEPGAAEVHGITDDLVANERPDTEVVAEWWSDIMSLLKPGETLVMGGHNTQFDMRAIKRYVTVPGVLTLCSMKLGRLYNPEAENHKLTTLHQYLGLPGTYQAHAAFDDVLMSLDIMTYYSQKLGLGYVDLAKAQSKPVVLKTMPFGKWKGSPISAIDASYMRYVLGLSDIDPDVKYSFQMELQRRSM